ncbi:MAG: TIGR01212 family radical SAM protein [Bacteroidetes bacterium]|nr:MAG: TIGR01212 family radical SAM protein [Bacteroidota bacterium]
MDYPWGNSRRFHSLADYYKQRYGSRIQKVSVHAGFTCPNRDGTVGTGGCTFCNNNGFSPSYCHENISITTQIEKGLEFLKKRYRKARVFVAYFQAYSNTYAEINILKERYEEALAHPGISGLSIGTRPDCIDDEKLDYLADIAKDKIVSIEYGVESTHEATLVDINRGHTFSDSIAAIEKTAARGLHTGIHLIMGLPGESRQQMLMQSRIISQLPVNSVKFHQLQIVKDTPMAEDFLRNPEKFHFFEPEEYVDFMVDFLENLRPEIAIERFAGEVPPDFNLRKSWSGLRSDQVIDLIEKRLKERNSWQGKKYPS